MVLHKLNGSSKNLKSEVSKGITITLLLLFKKLMCMLNKT